MRIANRTVILQSEHARFDAKETDLNDKKKRIYNKLQPICENESSWNMRMHPNKLLCAFAIISSNMLIKKDCRYSFRLMSSTCRMIFLLFLQNGVSQKYR